MNIKKYFEGISNASSLRSHTWILITLLIISNVLLSVRAVFVQDSEKTIIVPASINKQFWVEGTNVSKEYLIQMSDYFVQLMYNATPANIDERTTLLLNYVSPKEYSALERSLGINNNLVKQTNISTSFFPTMYGCDEKTITCHVDGEFVVTQGEKVVQRQFRQIEIKFENESAGIKVLSLKDLTKQGADFRKKMEVDPTTSSKTDPISGQVVEESVDKNVAK